MKKFFSFFIIFSLFFLFSCGKKGPIFPPIIQIPQKVEVFNGIQRGDKIILVWDNPTTYIDGNPLGEISEVEIWLFEEKKESTGKEEPVEAKLLSQDEFEKKAKLLASIKKEKFSEYQAEQTKELQRHRYLFPLVVKENLSIRLIFGIRIKDKKKRESEFSDLLYIEPRILSLPPQNLRYTVFKDRIQILWDPPKENIDQSSSPNIKGYNIYRAEEEAEPTCINSTLIKENKYEDKDFLFDKAYRYFIRVSATDSPPFLESNDSDVLNVVARDEFAPEPPSGLVSITGKNYISLSWDENRERDLAGYRVWRKGEGEEHILMTPDPIRENTYTDTKVEKNKRYYYSITALDKNGNESKKSKAASEMMKDIFYENLSL